jgi:hypothetical protein
MPIQSSLPTVAEQIITFNANIVEILSRLNSITTTTDDSVEIRLFDSDGVLNTYNLPSFQNLKNEIERLNNSINSIYNIDGSGALVQTTSQNQFKKIISVDLNKEPISISGLDVVTTFKSEKNWIFDGLLNPILKVEFDLSNRIQNNVRKCLVRRYIVDFQKSSDGRFTQLGQSAIQSFNSLFRGRNDISIESFRDWYSRTPGVVNPNNPNWDEDTFDLEPNVLLYDGVFNVIRIEEDTLNKKLWYHVNTLDYIVSETGELKQLGIGDEIIINVSNSSTRYKIIEISNSESNPRLRFERVEGFQPIPVGIGTIKIYSPVVYTKRLRVSIGYDERNVIFIKPVNADTNLIAKDWSPGVGFYTNDLRLRSGDSLNGSTMEDYYIEEVLDYGEVLKDLAVKKKPNILGGVPTPPVLTDDNFKVVQINRHLTDNPDANLIKNKHNSSIALKNEIRQIEEAIEDRNKKIRFTRFTSNSEKKKFELELDELVRKKSSKSRLFSTTVQEILDISRNPSVKVIPKYRLRGFWDIPEAILVRGTTPQEIVQFRVQYRYVSKDGREPVVESFSLDSESGDNLSAVFSNWNEFKTDVRKRVFNKADGTYRWVIEDVENADTPNINQLDISISPNERVEIRIKSISEVGWPESPIESDWSNTISIEFPDELGDVLSDNEFILKEADKEELRVSIESELTSRGLGSHLSETVSVNDKLYFHNSDSILSGFRDNSGVSLSLFQYLEGLEDRIRSLEERIKRVKGELEIIIIRNNQEFIIENNSDTVFNIECEDYLEPFVGTGIQSGRVYANNIYVIKDFAIRVRNKSVDSILGLLSNRTYTNNPDVYNDSVPQSFWVNNQDELVFSNVSGTSQTQNNNQFIWLVNYESIQSNLVTRLSENVGNNFTTTNSITNILSLNEFNIGYGETTPLSFQSSNNSLLDSSKWIDNSVSVGSTTKFLTTIHPVIDNLSDITETNVDRVKSISSNGEIIIPINIYFKLNSLDNTQSGANFEYVNLNKQTQTVKHIKKLKFLLENESENRPFVFSLTFNLNRNKVTFTSKPKNYSTRVK